MAWPGNANERIVVTVSRGEVLWTPPADAWQTTALGRFATEQGFADFDALIRWSIDELDDFWRASTDFTGVRWVSPPRTIRDGDTMPDVLPVVTHGGSTAFANPTVTALTSPAGRPAIVATVFIPSEGAADGEGGELIYYRELVEHDPPAEVHAETARLTQ